MIAGSLDAETRLGGQASRSVLALGFIVGLANFAYYYARGLTTAHYDAKAHLVLARGVLDSTRPGYAQLGVNWLPLTHLLYLPFASIDGQYRSAFLPSLLSVISFALSAWLVFRIVARFTRLGAAGLFAAVYLVANANLQYLQSCPLTEPLYILLLLSAVDSLILWRESGARSLPWAPAIWTSLGGLCRYEGWYLLAGIILLLLWDYKVEYLPRRSVRRGANVILIMFLAPVAAHVAYVHAQFGDTFLNRVVRGHPLPYETFRRPILSVIYHLGELSQVAGILPLIAGLTGLFYCLMRCRPGLRRAPLFLLWLPSLMNVSALYWGLIYRVRYSSLLLPALAVFGGITLLSGIVVRRLFVALCFVALALPWLSWCFPQEWKYRFFFPGPGILFLPAAALVLFLIGRTGSAYHWPLLALVVSAIQVPALRGEHRPMVVETLEHEFIEPERRQVLSYLRDHYDGSRILIDIGRLAPLVYDSGLAVREFVYGEGDSISWKRAMEAPHITAGWLCLEKGDKVWQAVQVDPHWPDRYSLAVQTEHFLLYRLGSEFRQALPPGRRHE